MKRLTRRPLIESLHPVQRRGFLKMLGIALAIPGVPAAARFAARALALGEAKAEDMEKPPINFIEIDLRDQWDFGHVFVAPGLATAANLKRGDSGRMCAVYHTPDTYQHFADRRVYLTPLSAPLAPHLDTIAMIETCEHGIGEIHGHEASNPSRSPGRSQVMGPGRGDMGANEPGNASAVPGNQQHFSSTPTPAALHNHWIKTADPAVKNGIAFKGVSREHCAFHYGAGLPGSEVDRKQTVEALIAAFPDKIEDYNVVPTPQQAEALKKILGAVDDRYLVKHKYDVSAQGQHVANLDQLSPLLYQGEPKLISLPLTEAELGFWRDGVGSGAPGYCPDQVGANLKCNIWEQCAYAYKLIQGGQCRTVALEFDYLDVHDTRPQYVMDTMALQTVLPLVRLIESLKAAGLYENTLIAIYTLDSGRAPAANSAGSEGKTGLMLAGGMINGGYYGDVGVAGDDGDGHIYSYSAPDPDTGAPLGAVTDNSNRLASAHVWRTVIKALGIPDALAASFPDTAGGKSLDWLLRA
jgi:hypothetical protein